MSDTPADPWLLRWLPLIAQHGAGQPVLELGCGSGRDSAVIVAAGHALIGIDLSAEAIAAARRRVPSADFHCRDIRDPFPAPAQLGVVLASLCLHYFDWDQTRALAERICHQLRPGGLLLCRLNSTQDVHHGARGDGQPGEPFYLVDGIPKRFFDRAAVDRLFAQGWRPRSVEHQVVQRYALPKALWEVVLERAA